jgi:hypothetical protein
MIGGFGSTWWHEGTEDDAAAQAASECNRLVAIEGMNEP